MLVGLSYPCACGMQNFSPGAKDATKESKQMILKEAVSEEKAFRKQKKEIIFLSPSLL